MNQESRCRFVLVLRRGKHSEVQYSLLYLRWLFPLKWIAFIEYIIQAATECPNVDLVRKRWLLENELGCRVVDVPGKIGPFQQFLEVIGQSNSVEFNNTTTELLDATRVHVSVNIALVMQIIKT